MMGLFIKELTVIDCSRLDADYLLLGDSILVDLTVEGDLNEEDFVIDFGIVKRSAKKWIDEHLDHKLIITDSLSGLHLQKFQSHVEIHYEAKQGRFIDYHCPNDALCLILSGEINDRFLEDYIARGLKRILPKNIKKISVKLYRQNAKTNFIQYNHGLKKHRGNCHRLAHGHRSQLEIYINGVRHPKFEKYYSSELNRKAICNREDIIRTMEIDGTCYLDISYESKSGRYFLRGPENLFHFLNHDPSIERIVEQIAKDIHEKNPTLIVEVIASEGVKKGAFIKFESE